MVSYDSELKSDVFRRFDSSFSRQWPSGRIPDEWTSFSATSLLIAAKPWCESSVFSAVPNVKGKIAQKSLLWRTQSSVFTTALTVAVRLQLYSNAI